MFDYQIIESGRTILVGHANIRFFVGDEVYISSLHHSFLVKRVIIDIPPGTLGSFPITYIVEKK